MIALAMWLIVYIWLGCTWAMTGGLENKKRFVNMWLAEIHGGHDVAQNVARSLGFTFNGQASHFKDHYVMIKDDLPEVSEHHGEHYTRDLLEFDEVKWAKQQTLLEKSIGPYGSYEEWDKKYEDAQEEKLMTFLRTSNEQGSSAKCSTFFSCLKFPISIMNFLRSIGDVDVKNLGKFSTKPLKESFLDESKGVTQHIELKSRKVSFYALKFNDPNWRKQWYIHDYRTKQMPVMDHNVVPVYEMGIKGKKVTVAILDDGVVHDHPDLKGNFDPSISYDVCQDKPGSMPTKQGKIWTDATSHGTSCAGVIAMMPNNRICGVGIAFEAKVAGIRMICPSTTNYIEAQALSHAVGTYDIYSGSWTPSEFGSHMCTLDHLVEKAYIDGTTNGRGGKGAIYVQSVGNGRHFGNNCAANCYVNNPYVIGIAAANQKGKVAYYSDPCSAIFATAYSGSRGMEGITTLHANGGCRDSFSGTSAAVPVAAGIIALVLDAEPDLTYRDVMHLIAMTAEVAPLADNKDSWYKNGRGLWVSTDFGFGLLNAENMVMMARFWRKVPKKHTCTVNLKLDQPKLFLTGDRPVYVLIDTDGCQTSEQNTVNYLEHIEVTADVRYPVRGGIMMLIRSPANTVTWLLYPRPKDEFKTTGLDGWNFMSVHNWGEDPKGRWQIMVAAESHSSPYTQPETGEIHGFTIKFHGTAEQPHHYSKPREYAAFRLPDGKTSRS